MTDGSARSRNVARRGSMRSRIRAQCEADISRAAPIVMHFRLLAALALSLIGAFAAVAPAHAQGPAPATLAEDLAHFSLPPVGLRAKDVAVVINDSDPASVEVGRYYAAKRGIASEHVVGAIHAARA